MIAEQHDIFKKLSGSTIATLVDTSNPDIKHCDTFPLITYDVMPDGSTVTVVGEIFGEGCTKLIGVVNDVDEEQIMAADLDEADVDRYVKVLNDSYAAWQKTRH